MAPHFINVRLLLSGLGAVVPKEVPDGTTLGDLMATMEGFRTSSSSEQILVNGSNQPSSYKLQDGDAIAVAPKNVKAA